MRDLGDLPEVKNYKMDKSSAKEFLYGGVKELMSNRNYYYNSGVGLGYSYWTDEGKIAIVEYINLIGHKILQIEEEELDQRAKDLVLKSLKGD